MDEDRLIAIGLAAAGYGRGDPVAIMEWPVDLAIDVSDFVRFQAEHQQTKMILNQPKT